MERSSKFGKFGESILQPALSYRFRVVFNSRQSNQQEIDNQQYALLTRQVHDVDVDYLNKTLKLTIEQSIVGDEHELIGSLLEEPSPRIRIDTMNGNEQIHHSVEFSCKPVSHNISYNYAERSAPVTHKLQFNITSMTLLTVPVY